LYGCYGPRKAAKELNKVEKSYPSMLAEKAKQLYPCIGKTDSFYLVKWRDSIITVIDTEIDTINTIDTIFTDCSAYKARVKALLISLKKSYTTAPAKIITVTDSSKNYLYQSKINDLEARVNKYRTKYETWIKISACILGLLVISLVAYIVKLYYK
jgi:hypothetical protein